MKFRYQFICVLIIFILSGCFSPIFSEQDSSAGLNGSFEKIKFSLPLNWYIYAAEDYKKTYDLVYDTVDAQDGKQSLKFEIRKVDQSTHLFKKPGFFGNIEATAGDKCKVSFWVKNDRCDFKITVSSYGEKDPKPVIRTNEYFVNWKYFEYEHTVPEKSSRIKFELNIFSPGNFWIDDIKIEKIKPGMIN